MFDIGWTELLVIAMVAIVVVGPKDLPRLMRTVGGTVTQVRRMARDFQRQINDAVRDEELEKLQRDMAKTGRQLDSDIRRSLVVPSDVTGKPEGADGTASYGAAAEPVMTPLLRTPQEAPVAHASRNESATVVPMTPKRAGVAQGGPENDAAPPPSPEQTAAAGGQT